VDATTVDEDTLREVAAACPTQAIVLEDVIEPVQAGLAG
jgi:ferredoxin